MTLHLCGYGFRWILPEITITVLGLVILLIDVFMKEKKGSAVTGVLTLIGSALAFYFAAKLWGVRTDLFSGLYTIDDFGTFFKLLFLAILFLVGFLSLRFTGREGLYAGEYYSLLSFAALGMMVMVSTHSFITIFIGLELMSLAIYILCGMLKDRIASTEASFKYFLLGSFATAFFLYGIALVYASTAAIDLRAIRLFTTFHHLAANPLFLTGMALILVGFGFKTASVPFHMWTPDVYEGAPTSVTAFMATGVKAAAFGAFLRVFYMAFFPFINNWAPILWFIAVLTMCVGNIVALVQTNIKRLLAYSSIAHAGYILVALIAGDLVLSSSVLYYLVAYTFMNLGAFTIVILLGRKGEENEDIDSYAGLAVRHPFVALCMTIFLLSLTGIPPLAGFAGKFYVFSAAIKSGYYWLAVIGMLNSAVAAYYYLRIVMYMYFKEPTKEIGKVDMSVAYVIPVLISVAALLYMGIMPRGLLLMAQKAVAIFL